MKKNVLTCLMVLLVLGANCFGQSILETAPILETKTTFIIDGSPDEWPIPATVFLKSRVGNAQMRFAADRSYFYAFVEVDDSSPLKNSAGEPEEMFKGGDAVVFYFNSTGREGYWHGPQRIAMCMRNGEPEIYVYREKSFGKPAGMKKSYVFKSPAGEANFDFVAPFDNKFSKYGPEFAFKKYGDKGYALEIKIPWDALRMNKDELTGFDAQVVFSNPAGNENVGAAWLFATEGPGLTTEDLPTEARLYPDTWGKLDFVQQIPISSAGSFSKFEKIVGGAYLDVDLPRTGFLTINITDKDGWILRELVMAQKYKAGKQSIYWDGRDRYGEPLPPGSYTWKAILFDPMRTKFMGSVGNSGRPPYRTPDGLGSMGGQHGSWKTLAIDDGGVYMGNALKEGPPVMRKINADTGVALWHCSSAGLVRGIAADEGMACFINKSGSWGRDEYQVIRIDPDTGRDMKMGDGPTRVSLDKDLKEIGGLTIVDGNAWFSLPEKNLIASLNLNTGNKGKEFKVTSPLGLTKKDQKTLLVCSENNILAVDTTTGIAKTIIKGLDSPRAVYVDNDGNMYVSELGSSQTVTKFSPDGIKTLAVFGKKGGKSDQQIPYEPTSFRNVTDIVVEKNGNIWLSESDPLVKRFVKLDSTGRWLEDFYGPVAYNTFGPDIDDLSRVYYTINGGNFIETKVDYDQYQKNPLDPAKGWQVKAIHSLGVGADGKSVNEEMQKVASKGYGHIYAFKADNGNRYMFRPSKGNRAVGHDGAGLWIEKSDRWIPCAFISKDTEKTPSWADKNGDGLIQSNEQYTNMPPVGEISWMDRDFALNGFKGKLAVGSTSGGIPSYVAGKYNPYLAEGEDDHLDSGWTFFSKEQDGSIYYILNHGPHRHMGFWDRATENRLVKVKDGKVQWITGEHAAHPGFTGFSTCSSVAGSQDGIVLVGNIEPCNYIAYTDDGFVLGDIMVNEDGWHENYQPYTINIESFTGLYIKDPKTGKNVLFTVSSGDDRILEVIGPKNVKRLQGTVQLTDASPAKGKALEIPYFTWYGNTVRWMGVDGTDTEWNPKIKAVSIMNDEQVAADVRLRRDAGELYIYASINDKDMKIGDGLKVIISGSATTREYALLLTLDRDKDGEWICKARFSKNGNEVADPKITAAVKLRWEGLGYRIEAGIPLSLMLDLSENKEVTFKRMPKKKTDPSTFTEVRPDLKAPVYINMQVEGSDVPGVLSKGMVKALVE